MLAELTLILAGTCAATSALTLLVSRAAPRFGLIDRPDSHRKAHRQPVPLAGGLAVFLATATTLGALSVLPGSFGCILRENWPGLAALLLAGTVIVLVGIVDDRRGLRGGHKLLGQILAASIVISSGLVIKQLGMLGREVALGPLGLPFTFFWLLGAINALNLLDGIDGLASMLGLIMVATIGVTATMTGTPHVAVIALVFAGSLLGFMLFNFPPARVFLGDAGSMLIGLVVGALAIEGSLKGPGTVLLAAPLAVWTIPIFDTSAAIIRRKLTGRSIYTSDRGHVHHRLMDLVGSNLKVLCLLASLCALTSAAALVSVFLDNDLIALVTCAGLVGMLIATGVFGRAELLLLVGRLCHLSPWLVRPAASNGPRIRQTTIRLQGSRQWETLWRVLTNSAEKFHLDKVCLDLNLPAEKEGYTATWERPSPGDFEHRWHVDLPLGVADKPVGRLTIAGERNGKSTCRIIEQLLELVKPFEARLRALAAQDLPALRVDSAAAVAQEHAQPVGMLPTGALPTVHTHSK